MAYASCPNIFQATAPQNLIFFQKPESDPFPILAPILVPNCVFLFLTFLEVLTSNLVLCLTQIYRSFDPKAKTKCNFMRFYLSVTQTQLLNKIIQILETTQHTGPLKKCTSTTRNNTTDNERCTNEVSPLVCGGVNYGGDLLERL